ncbi:relaxase/mobilization nuclease domain-containing protein [Clostridioides difficile]
MTLLATFKHISSKNADYGAAEQYLTFEHDEFTMKPTLDEAGRLILREDYRIATLNCGEEDFAVACMRSNLRYGKNQKREDVKSHHYIISFDPRDATDNGLTVDRAQRLGEKFCAEHFPGHQAIVCTHSDGHNHSGNIHVHIVINSLRIEEVPLLSYMDRPADTRAGCKHRCTDVAMEYFKAEVMEMCHRENLYQIDLLNGSKNRITEREYWAQKKGQLALDKENAAALAAGQPVRQTKFETDKAKLRQTIRNAMNEATTFDEFSALLLQQGVTVKESRGRLSYLTPDRTKPITARKLGDDFDKAAVLALLTQNAHRAAEQTTAIPEYPHTQKGRLREEKAKKTTPVDNTLQRMVDREAKRAEGKGVGYDRWAAKHNLKQMAATVTAYQQYGFSSPEELDEACSAAYAAMQESLTELKQVEKTLNGKRELQRQVLAYSKTRPVRDGLKQQKNAKAKAAYRQKHESDFIIADAAARYFRENGISKLPSYKSLQAEIEVLIKEKNSGYNDYRAKREEYRRLQTVKGNIDQILRRERKPVKRQEQER